MKLTVNDPLRVKSRMTAPAIWFLYKRQAVLQAEHGDSGEYDKGSVTTNKESTR